MMRQQPQIVPRSFLCTISKSAALTCMFSAYVFLQFTVLGLANHAGEGYLSTGQRELVYYALQVFVILGYLLYSLFDRFCAGNRIRKITAAIVFGLFFTCVTLMLTAGNDSLLSVAVSMAAALCLGVIGGAVHYRMSLECAAGAEVARFMGLGSAAAVVLQYLLQIRWGVSSFLPLFMLAAFVLIVLFLTDGYLTADFEGDRKEVQTAPGRLLFSILIAVVFILSACFYNEYIHHLQIQSAYESYNVYSWPRLMLVPGYLLYALIGDRKNGRYVPITTLCVMLIMLLNVTLVGNPGAYRLNMCLFYFAISAFTSYYLLTFWRLAPDTSHPALWAPFGRILDSAMVLFTGMIRLSSLPALVVLGADIIGLALVILMMALNGDFNLTEMRSAEKAEMPDLSPAAPDAVLPLRGPEETLSRMRENFQLTPREMDVLRELVLTEDKQTVISERLSIQVKTLQDYVTRLYRKTGVMTRAGLTDLYHETRNRS